MNTDYFFWDTYSATGAWEESHDGCLLWAAEKPEYPVSWRRRSLGQYGIHPPNKSCTFCQSIHEILRGSASLWYGHGPRPYFTSRYIRVLKTTIRAHGVSGQNLQVLCARDAHSNSEWYNQKGGVLFVPLPLDSLWTPFRILKSTIDLEVPKAWLHCCHETHQDACHSYLRSSIPGFQLVDCSSRRIVPMSSSDEYLTLSYLWGQEIHQCRSAERGELPTDLPAVIDDAITLTTALGYRFIWIDRYCIPQDDAASKHIQIQNMGAIYSSSALTIIAAAGNGPGHGLPGVGESARVSISITTVESGPKIPWVDTSLRQDILESQWNQRGWTYQEALLSPRRLVFTDNQMYFQCQEMHAVESLRCLFLHDKTREDEVRYSKLSEPIFTSLRENPSVSFWTRANEYVRRALSFEEDTLDAFQGIIRMFKETDPSFQSIFGIPLHTKSFSDNTACFLSGLVWIICHEDWYPHGPRSWEKQIYPIRRRKLPSWSWTDWKAAPNWPDDRDLFESKLPGNIYPAARVAFEAADGSIVPLQTHHHTIFILESQNMLKPILRLTGWTFELDISGRSEIPWFESESVFRRIPVKYEVGLAAHLYPDATRNSPRRIKCIALYTYKTGDVDQCRVLLISRKPETTDYERIAPLDLPFFGDKVGSEVWDDIHGCPGPKFFQKCALEEVVLC